MFLQPQGVKKDQEGKPVLSKFGGSQPYQTVTLNPSGGDRPTIDAQLVTNWKSNSSDLQTLNSSERNAINSIKRWINYQDCAVWFHDGNSDLCSQFGGPHLHVVIKSTPRLDGTFPVLQHHRDYKTLGRSITSCAGLDQYHNSYIKSQRVRKLPNLVKYLGTSPRIYLGTRSVSLGQLRREILSDREHANDAVTDLGCDEDELDAGGACDKGEPCYDDDFGQVNRESTKRGRDTDDFSNAGDEVCIESSQPTKRANNANNTPSDFTNDAVALSKDTNVDRLSNLLERIMTYLNAYDYESIITAVGRLDKSSQTHKNITTCWQKLVTRPGTLPTLQRVRDRLKVTYQGMTFTDMAEKWMESKESNDPNYIVMFTPGV